MPHTCQDISSQDIDYTICRFPRKRISMTHYSDVIMSMNTSQITSLMIVYSTIYSGADQSKYQSSASLTFVMGIHWWPVTCLHKGPVTRKMFPFDDFVMHRISVMIWEYLFIPSLIFSISLYQFLIKQQCYLRKQMRIIMEWNSTQTIQSWITEYWWHILCIWMVE